MKLKEWIDNVNKEKGKNDLVRIYYNTYYWTIHERGFKIKKTLQNLIKSSDLKRFPLLLECDVVDYSSHLTTGVDPFLQGYIGLTMYKCTLDTDQVLLALGKGGTPIC